MADQVGVAENFIRPQRGNADIAHARQPEGAKVRLHALLLLLLRHGLCGAQRTEYCMYVAALKDSCYFLPKTCLRMTRKVRNNDQGSRGLTDSTGRFDPTCC